MKPPQPPPPPPSHHLHLHHHLDTSTTTQPPSPPSATPPPPPQTLQLTCHNRFYLFSIHFSPPLRIQSQITITDYYHHRKLPLPTEQLQWL